MSDFEVVKPIEFSAVLPSAWAKYRLGAVILANVPSANEVKRAGKRLAEFRERWRSLPASFAVTDPVHVYRFPGSKLEAIVAFSKALPASLKTYGDLAQAPIGRWFDLQVIDRDRLVAFTIREFGELYVARPESKCSVDQAYGERTPLPDAWLEYLRS